MAPRGSGCAEMIWTEEQLARLAQLSGELLDLSVPEQQVWLIRARAQHPDLAAALESMVNAPTSLLVPPALTLPFDVDEQMPGQGGLVGPFRLVSPLGQGGVGVVWLADQVDGRVRRRVALKLLRSHLQNAGWRQRFARERDILAGLSHPGIARIIDADVGESGLAYLAMDYIDGEGIVQHAATHASPPQTCVEQVVALLDAVAYAHDMSVVHRDIKPSNVLVDRSGRVVLLDFGIAKLLQDNTDDAPGADAQALTAVFGRPLTLEYASPEQVAGQPLGVQTDVYSVGVLLFELLAGQGPYQMPRHSRAALAEAILSQPLEGPSQRVLPVWAQRLGCSAAQLADQLRGDLDAIVLKALQRDLTKRYASASDFAADLRRWLAGQSVAVRPASPAPLDERLAQHEPAETTPTLPGPAQRIRDLIRKHLSPTRTVMSFSLTFVSLVDLLVPRLLLIALIVRGVALVFAALIIVAALWPRAFDRLLTSSGLMKATKEGSVAALLMRRFFSRRLLLPSVLVAVALSATLSQADTGGVVASHAPSLRSLQQQLLGLQSDVKVIAEGVNKANQTLDDMATRAQALQEQIAADPVSIGLMDLQGVGQPAKRGESWPARLAVYLNAGGYDFNTVQLLMATGGPDGQQNVENLSSALGSGSGPGAVQIMVAVPPDSRWVSACLLLPASPDSSRRAVLHRWRVTPQPDLLRVEAEGPPQLRSADDRACAI